MNMDPITYGEMVAIHLSEQRREAARSRLARAAVQPIGIRPRLGRLLIAAGRRIGGQPLISAAPLSRRPSKPFNTPLA